MHMDVVALHAWVAAMWVDVIGRQNANGRPLSLKYTHILASFVSRPSVVGSVPFNPAFHCNNLVGCVSFIIQCQAACSNVTKVCCTLTCMQHSYVTFHIRPADLTATARKPHKCTLQSITNSPVAIVRSVGDTHRVVNSLSSPMESGIGPESSAWISLRTLGDDEYTRHDATKVVSNCDLQSGAIDDRQPRCTSTFTELGRRCAYIHLEYSQFVQVAQPPQGNRKSTI
jgi:hypothetical protein